jgi:hypothetical protein
VVVVVAVVVAPVLSATVAEEVSTVVESVELDADLFELQAATDTEIANANKPKLNKFFIVVLSKSYLNNLPLIRITQKGNLSLNKKYFPYHWVTN